jgi:Caspase domain/Domain of unknown function (DUF4189)
MHRYAWLFVATFFLFAIITDPAIADNRVALVIGNGAYAHAPQLPNPSHDAQDVAAALKRTGFQTIVGIDLDQAGMQDAAIRFARAARTADVAMFYYSGHALQFAGVNYMIPVDAQLRDEADLRRMIRVDEVVADLQQAKNLRILVLDSCRDNPLADELKRSIGITRSASIGRGLARIDSPEGMIIAYATQAGRTAEDGDGYNSPYTAAFLKNIEAKDEIGTIFRRISSDVYTTTRQAQLPELSLSLIGEFYLNGKMQITVTQPPAMPTDACVNASEHWKSAEAIGTLDAYEDHVARFPNCTFSELAKARIEGMKKKNAMVAPPVPPPAGPQIGQAMGQYAALAVVRGQGHDFHGLGVGRSPIDASQAALAQCANNHCEVVQTYSPGQCVHLALGDRQIFWNRTLFAARERESVLEACSKADRRCKIATSGCLADR